MKQQRYGHLGNYLQSCREDAGLTQGELSKKTKVIGQCISNWERGLSKPSKTSMRVLVKELKLDYQTLRKAFIKDFKVQVETMFKEIRKAN